MKTYLISLLRRYLIAGAAGTTVHFALLILLAPVLGALPASTSGATAGAALNYLLLKKWVFENRAARPARYAALCVVSIAANTLLMATISSFGVGALSAQILSTGLMMIVNFAVSNNWVFKHETTRCK